MARFKTKPGNTYPLGSSYDGEGVNFALFSAHAQKVELCLFDSSGSQEIDKFEISTSLDGIWSVYLQGAKPGQVYGYRVYGPYEPLKGHRFNHHKLLIDPYGKQLVGKLIWHKSIFGYDVDSPDKDLSFSDLDSSPYVPKSVVVSDDFDWEGDVRPNVSRGDTIVYEAHTRGFTKIHPQVKDAERGTFKGLASKVVTKYLRWLGVTAIELLPIHAFFGNRHKKGYIVDNYWGYESMSFFAPEQSYLATSEISEFKEMVKEFHRNGLEVFLDVVYNHTGGGNQMGPTLCYRGIDNASYYVLNPDDRRFYYDSTGVGASFNVSHPRVLQLVMDSLRYWADVMRVDGFRFDLAPTLCRQPIEFKRDCGFLYACAQDPVINQVKLIAEPWDLGWGGYQVGAFLPGWQEWNDKFRDVTRRFWKGDEGQAAEMASRLLGSSDVFNHEDRAMWSSVNFITAHDGFCLMDLVSYNGKHNHSNGEENRDGTDSNWSWNSGAEGETDSPMIRENRLTRVRAMLSTLFLAFGTPMMVAGDEFGRTQFGNNNPYCQDNILTWIPWESITDEERELVRFVKKLIDVRKKLKFFNRSEFFTGFPDSKNKAKDLTWYTENGTEFRTEDWHNSKIKSIGSAAFVGSKYIYIILNAESKDKEWTLPSFDTEYSDWTLLVDSSTKFKDEKKIGSGKHINVPAWGVLLFDIKK